MTFVRRISLVSVLAAGLVLVPGLAWAHPLGNFTINAYGGLVVRPSAIVVDFVLDMAEIPTYQERTKIDRNTDGALDAGETQAYRESKCAAMRNNLSLAVDGHPATLRVTDATLEFLPGAAGLTTLRLTCLLDATIGPSTAPRTVTYEDATFPGRLGWHEITAVGDRTTLVKSSVPTASSSNRLRSYPKGVLPLGVRTATLNVRPGGPVLTAPIGERAIGEATTAPERAGGGGLLADLAGRQNLSLAIVSLILLVAFGAGALHALGPGHGKSMIGAYLVGSGGSIRQAAVVGAAVSLMHTASVLALGLIVVSAERFLPPEKVYPWLGLGSGLIALTLGASLLVSRLHRLDAGHGHSHGHEEGHTHGGYGHEHPVPEATLSRKGLIALAVAGGVLPSPSALVVLLISISLGRTVFGLVVIGAFSIGLAASLVGVGALALGARELASRYLSGKLWRLAPFGSAAAIAIVGAALTIKGITQV